jgi:hypothetical protein
LIFCGRSCCPVTLLLQQLFTSEKYDSSNITSEKYDSSNITSEKYDSSNITSEKYDSSNITSEKYDSSNTFKMFWVLGSLFFCFFYKFTSHSTHHTNKSALYSFLPASMCHTGYH